MSIPAGSPQAPVLWQPSAHRVQRKLRAALRDTWLLIRQFRWPLLGLFLAVIGGGALYYLLARQAGEPLDSLAIAGYHVLSLMFLQSLGDFPHAWYLGIFYFVMPLLGVMFLAQGVTEFGMMLFNRQARAKEWEMAVASTFNDHVVLVGLGHLGFHVAQSLFEMGRDVVVIETNPKLDLVASAKEMGIPVIQDDASRASSLAAAGIDKARSVILCMQNDSLNLKIALKAQKLNPRIQVVIRIFDDDFAHSLHEHFGFSAFSATGMAAPAFAAAAAGLDITRPITIEGQTLALARLTLTPASPLAGCSVGELEQDYNVSVVLVRRNSESDLHPASDRILLAGDSLAILGGPAELSHVAQNNT